MSKFDVAQNQAPKVFVLGVSLRLADVDSSGHLDTGGASGNAGTALTAGPKVMLMGPSGYVADVDSQGNLQTTNG